MCQSRSVCLACSAGLRSIRISIAPAAFNLFTMCSAIAPMGPVMRITLPERSMWIMVAVSVFGALLHDSVLFKCGDCATSLLQSLSHQLLPTSLFERISESLCGRFRRDHANSVDVAKQEITGAGREPIRFRLECESQLPYIGARNPARTNPSRRRERSY